MGFLFLVQGGVMCSDTDSFTNHLPSIEITKHSIDRFSERCLNTWLDNRHEEGIMSYLVREARCAYAEVLKSLTASIKVDSCRVIYNEIVFVFVTKNGKTSLVTVYPYEKSAYLV